MAQSLGTKQAQLIHHLDAARRCIWGGIREGPTAAEIQGGSSVAAQLRQRHHRIRIQADADGGGVGEAGYPAPGRGTSHAAHTRMVAPAPLRWKTIAHCCSGQQQLLSLQLLDSTQLLCFWTIQYIFITKSANFLAAFEVLTHWENLHCYL